MSGPSSPTSGRNSASDAEPRPRKSKRPFAILAVLITIVLVTVGAYMLATAGQEDTDDAQIMSDVVPVATRVSGQIVRVPILENQQVKQGDLLAEIDDADYRARVRRAEAELASAQAQAQAADAQVQVVRATSASPGSTRPPTSICAPDSRWTQLST